MTVFDGDNLTVQLDAPTGGVLNQTVENFYEDWKAWMLGSPENRYFPQMWNVSGGEDITEESIAGQYYFFRNDNGWRIITTDEDQEINWDGNLIPTDINSPIFTATAGRTIMHLGLQPLTTGLSQLSEILAAAQTAQSILEADMVFDQAAGLLHYYERGTTTDIIPAKTVVTQITQDTSLVE